MDKRTIDKLSRLEKISKRTASAHFSLMGADRCFDHYLSLMDGGDEILLNSLLVTAVVNYCRPFSTNKSEDGTKYQYPTKQLKTVDVYSSEIHELLMELRNKLIAHDDAATLDTKLSYMGASTSKNGVSENSLILVNTTAGRVYLIESKALCEKISGHIKGLVKILGDIQKKELTDLLTLLQTRENFSTWMDSKKVGISEEIIISPKETYAVPSLSNHTVSELEKPNIDGYGDCFRYITNSNEMGIAEGRPSELKIEVRVRQ